MNRVYQPAMAVEDSYCVRDDRIHAIGFTSALRFRTSEQFFGRPKCVFRTPFREVSETVSDPVRTPFGAGGCNTRHRDPPSKATKEEKGL